MKVTHFNLGGFLFFHYVFCDVVSKLKKGYTYHYNVVSFIHIKLSSLTQSKSFICHMYACLHMHLNKYITSNRIKSNLDTLTRNPMSVFLLRKENIMFFSRKDDVLDLVTKENHKLKKENNALKNKLNAISQYKEEYEELIKQTKEQKQRYIKLNDKLEELVSLCKTELDSIK